MSLRILVLHNRYTLRGGEDSVVDAEVAALRARGHEVHLHEVRNDDPDGGSLGTRVAAARRAIWSRRSAREVRRLVRSFRPHVAHVHNHAYELSASIFPKLAAADVPIVSTLHNYRMTCSATYLLRDGSPCELCVGSRASWQGIRHRCFRGSRSGSAMLAGMQLAYRRGALPNVARWIVLTEFARGIYERAHFPVERLVVRPNTIPDPGFTGAARAANAPVLFVGRLEESKGVPTLLEAWGDGIRDSTLQVIGDGPLHAGLVAQAPASVEVLGPRSGDEVRAAMRQARALVVPSTWYEGFPMVVLEAFAAGTPVIASDLGSLTEVVPDPDCGWRVPARDAGALRAAMSAALADPASSEQRGAAARARFEELYGQDRVMAQLEAIYADAISSR